MQRKRKLPYDATPDVHEFHTPPESIHDIINGWGTYNIQATSDTDDVFPLIGPALPTKWKDLAIEKKDVEDL